MSREHPLRLRRPRLPTADDVLPYLRRIDESGWYSNFGPLCDAFEARLATHFGVERRHVTTVCNATAGLTLSLQAAGAKPGTACAVPSYTFPATPAAVIAAGLHPVFVDIERDTLELSPCAVTDAVAREGIDLGAVMPVSAFGAPVGTRRWQEFQETSGVPVVIDAAWCFGDLEPGPLPQVISLHATKVFGIGEGGVVISTDADVVHAIQLRSNFGFTSEREVVVPGVNAKLSEYAAAVGHAGLDAWAERRRRLEAVHSAYVDALASVPGVVPFPPADASWVSATVAAIFAEPVAADVGSSLATTGIEARPWWGPPCHTLPAYGECGRGPLPMTEWASRHILNLPFGEDMERAEINEVAAALRAALT